MTANITYTKCPYCGHDKYEEYIDAVPVGGSWTEFDEFTEWEAITVERCGNCDCKQTSNKGE